MPFGFHGVFAALTGGVVFALQGFEQGVQLAGEARNPKKDRRARDPHRDGDRRGALLAAPGRDDRRARSGEHQERLARCRSAPSASAYGAWYTLALAVGAGWLAKMLLDRRRDLAGGHRHRLRRHDGAPVLRARRGARDAQRADARRTQGRAGRRHPASPRSSAASRSARSRAGSELVERRHRRDRDHVRVRAALARGAAPLDPDRPRTYRVPLPEDPAARPAFCSANLIIYWGGFETTWKLVARDGRRPRAVLDRRRARGHDRRDQAAQLALDAAVARRPRRCSALLGRYGGGHNMLPAWVATSPCCIAFSLAIFYYALTVALPPDAAATAISKDSAQLDFEAPSHAG